MRGQTPPPATPQTWEHNAIEGGLPQGIDQVRPTGKTIPITFDPGRLSDSHAILAALNDLAEFYAKAPPVRAWANEIIRTHRDNDVKGQVADLVRFVKTRIVYMRDPQRIEYVQDPLTMLAGLNAGQNVRGDCDDHVLLLASLLRSVGITARPVAVHLNERDRYDHVVVQILIDYEWRIIDPCAKGPQQPTYTEILIP